MSQVNDSSLRCDRYTGTVKIWLTKIDNIENIEIYYEQLIYMEFAT